MNWDTHMTHSGHEQDMVNFGAFERDLEKTLVHLFNPTFWPPEWIWASFGVDQKQGLKALWSAVSLAIEDIKPAQTVPTGTPIWRIYLLLVARYIHKVSQEEAAEKFGITPRHLRREQIQAVHALARQVWERKNALLQKQVALAPVPDPPKKTEGDHPERLGHKAESGEWNSQVKREVDSLSEKMPGMVAEVGRVIQEAAQFGRLLAEKRHVILETAPVDHPLVTSMHPSVLRQALISCIRQLSEVMTAGTITVQAKGELNHIRMTIRCSPIEQGKIPNIEFIQEFLRPHQVMVEFQFQGSAFSLHIVLQALEKVVLVLDDNKDMAHLYQRYTLGTRYHTVSIDRGLELFEAIKICTPDIITIDVMLPDIDGWMLLSQLRENPNTRDIPVIVCSVVREQDLALLLGAKGYLQKPVQRARFIQALDQATGA